MLGLYSSSELVQLRVLKGTDRDLEKRMPVKMTRHYFELAKTSGWVRGNQLESVFALCQ